MINIPDSLYQLTSIVSFGLHKGLTVQEIIELNPSWILWAYEHIDWFDIDYQVLDTVDQKLNPFYEDDRYFSHLTLM